MGPSGVTEYEYDELGNRTATVHDGVRTEYLLDPTGLVDVTAEYAGIGALVANYRHGRGLVSRSAASATDFYDFDAIGSTAGMSDAAGNYVNRYAYEPFGTTLLNTEGISNGFEFVGQFGVQGEAGSASCAHEIT